jgi:hypothetical protein
MGCKKCWNLVIIFICHDYVKNISSLKKIAKKNIFQFNLDQISNQNLLWYIGWSSLRSYNLPPKLVLMQRNTFPFYSKQFFNWNLFW